MIPFTILSYVLATSLLLLQPGDADIKYGGDHYDGAVTTGATAYSKSVWNYNYAHTLSAGVCKDSSGTTVTCAPSTQCGPACWAVAPDFGGKTNMCMGSNQTPINLAAANIDPSLSPPEFMVTDKGCDKWVQFGDDHAFEVSFSETGKACTNLQLKYAGTIYTLLQFHFHAPAEHAVAGGLGAAELHMVHKSADGKLLVLGVIMTSNGMIAGGGNQFLRNFWEVAYTGSQSENLYPQLKVPFSALANTVAGSTTINFASALTAATTPKAGDYIYDVANTGCVATGSTVVSTTANTVVMSSSATATCAVAKQFAFVPSCATLKALVSGTTAANSATITFAAAPTTLPAVGDTLADLSGNCFISGVTVVSTTATTVTMSSPALGTCNSQTFSYYTTSNLITAACHPANHITPKEKNIMSKIGNDVMSGQCQYALEYEADGQTPINPYVDFLPTDKSFLTYSGSLTTYPCSEGVTWIVYEQPMLVSPDDVKKIVASSACEAHTITMAQQVKSQTLAWADNRPLQPLGTRVLSKYEASAPTVAPTKMDVASSPISLAAIVIGCVALVVGGVAVGFALKKSSGSAKVVADFKAPVTGDASVNDPL